MTLWVGVYPAVPTPAPLSSPNLKCCIYCLLSSSMHLGLFSCFLYTSLFETFFSLPKPLTLTSTHFLSDDLAFQFTRIWKDSWGITFCSKWKTPGTSLVVQWLRLCFHRRGRGLDPCSGNYNPACLKVQQKNKINKMKWKAHPLSSLRQPLRPSLRPQLPKPPNLSLLCSASIVSLPLLDIRLNELKSLTH